MLQPSAFNGVIKRRTLILKDQLLTSDFVLSIYEFLDDQQLKLQPQSVENAANQRYDTFRKLLSLDDDDQCAETQSINTFTELSDIQGIDFWSCAFDNDISTAQLLSDVIMVFSELSCITKLYFSNNLLTDQHLQLLCNGLIYIYDLRELRIISNELTHLSLFILSKLFTHKDCKLTQNLRILDLSDNPQLIQTTEKGMQAFELFVCTLSNTHIQTLTLSHFRHLVSNHIYILSQWILNDNQCHLQHLDLSQNICTLPFIQSLCAMVNRSNCYLHTLILNECRFTKDSATYFGSNLHKNHNLDCLSLNGLQLASFLAFSNSDNEIRVRSLYLNDLCTRTQDGWYEISYGAISDAIVNIISSKFLYLEQLHMDRCDLHNDEVSDLAAFLSRYPWIRKVSLCNNCLNHQCLKRLSHAVKRSQKEAMQQTQIYCDAIVECIEDYLSDQQLSKNLVTDREMNRFTEDISYFVVEYLFKDPLDGIKCIFLQGNARIDTQFTANFRNCALLDAKILSKLAKCRYDGRENRNEMKHTRHKQLTWSKLLAQ